jgi:hypothetical protein
MHEGDRLWRGTGSGVGAVGKFLDTNLYLALLSQARLQGLLQAGWATASYLEAFAKLEAGDSGAVAAFAAHVGKLPGNSSQAFRIGLALSQVRREARLHERLRT